MSTEPITTARKQFLTSQIEQFEQAIWNNTTSAKCFNEAGYAEDGKKFVELATKFTKVKEKYEDELKSLEA